MALVCLPIKRQEESPARVSLQADLVNLALALQRSPSWPQPTQHSLTLSQQSEWLIIFPSRIIKQPMASLATFS